MSSIQMTGAAAVLLSAASQAMGDIGIHDAYAVGLGTDASSGMALMVIHNHDGEPDRLLSASTPAAARVEIHDTAVDGEAPVMAVQADGIALSAWAEVALEPGGLHLMLVGLTAPLTDGDVITLTLTFEGSGTRVVEVPVRLAGPVAASSDEEAPHRH